MTDKAMQDLLEEVKAENTEADTKAFELFCKEELRKQLNIVDNNKETLKRSEEALAKLMEEGTLRNSFDSISNSTDRNKITRSMLDDAYNSMQGIGMNNMSSIMNRRTYS